LCLPSTEQMISAVRQALDRYNSANQRDPVRHLYIAADYANQTVWQELKTTFPDLTVLAPGMDHQPHFLTDLYLLSHANVFVGNCISSFSAFVSRLRVYRFPFFETTHFFAFDRPNSVHLRDEL